MKVLSICFTAKVNQIATSSKIPKMSRSFNFTSDVSVHAIVTCQGVFVPVPAFDDYFILLVQHIVLSINSDLQLSLKQSRHRFVLTLYCWYRLKFPTLRLALLLKLQFSKVHSIVASHYFASCGWRIFYGSNILFHILFLICGNKFSFESFQN